MALTAATISSTAVADTTSSEGSGVPTGGTTPYLYQWCRSTTSGFAVSTANYISGATLSTLSDSGLVPGTIYYYKQYYTDSNATPLTVTSAQITVTTLAAIASQNQFAGAPWLGQLDLKFNPGTLSCQVDASQTGSLMAGDAVTFSTATGPSVPRVSKSTAAADHVCGFVVYNHKDATYKAGARVEIALKSNVIYLMAAGAINRGQFVTNLPSGVAGGTNGGVIAVTGSSALDIIGFSLDQAAAAGTLVRIWLECPTVAADTTPNI